VSWEDGNAFCDWLTDQEHQAGKLRAGARYRLPSDHEWSCAVGIGGQEDAGASPAEKHAKILTYPWGTVWPPPKGSGNYADDSRASLGGKSSLAAGYDDGFGNTSPVTAFPPNALGLYDLAGNVWEWCADKFGGDGPSAAFPVMRGGSWDTSVESYMRSSSRYCKPPSTRYGDFGFRCVLAVGAGD
jgi:formylglycine-generating enzyme required for sulfatase activity